MAKDPVCGMEVDPKASAGSSTYQGETYYFCSERCKETFDENPDAYVARADARQNPSPAKGRSVGT